MKVLEIKTWIDMFDPSEINVDKIQEYLDFIKEAMDHRDPNRYSESHHILPGCLDKEGTYDHERALINGRDHFLAHMKLVDCFNGIKKRSMSCALVRMRSECKKDITPEEWEISRALVSEANKGDNNPTKRLETRIKLSQSLSGKRPTEEWCRDHSKRMSGAGNPMYGKHHSEEVKRRLSELNSGTNSPVYGKHWKLSDETREKLSKAHKGRFVGEKNPFYGKKHTEETKQLMRKNHKDFSGENHPNYGKTGPLCLSYDTIWITNGVDNKRIKKGEKVPDGWSLGKTHSVKKCWVTNGTDNMYIDSSQTLPNGWNYGRTFKKKINK